MPEKYFQLNFSEDRLRLLASEFDYLQYRSVYSQHQLYFLT